LGGDHVCKEYEVHIIMPGDPKVCRQHAKYCWALASEVTNPVLRESLIETAQRWSRLAAELDAMQGLLDDWQREDNEDPKRMAS
jgi:hypothetical protein